MAPIEWPITAILVRRPGVAGRRTLLRSHFRHQGLKASTVVPAEPGFAYGARRVEVQNRKGWSLVWGSVSLVP